MAIGLVAFAVRLDVAAIAQILVHELALARGHRIQRDRPSVATGVLRGLVGDPVQRLGPPGAIALGVDDDPQITLVAGAPCERDAKGDVLDGVDRLPVAPDEEAEILAVDGAGDHLAVALHLDRALEAQRGDDLIEHLVDSGLRHVVHQRRLPVFFLRRWRGGRGGAVVRRSGAATSASALPWSRALSLSGGLRSGFAGAAAAPPVGTRAPR